MKTKDKAYLAGLIDGEGCISVLRQVRDSRPSPFFMARIAIAMTSESLVRWVKRTTGIGSVNPKPLSLPSKKKQWVWTADSYDAVRVVKIVLPFLRLKERQARNILAFQLNAVRTDKTNRCALTKTEIKLRTKYYKKSRRLNGGKTRGKF